MNIFEKGTREKLRFNNKGIATIEELWDLPLTVLDKMYQNLRRELKENDGESLLNIRSKKDDTTHLKIEIITHIVEVRVQENKEKSDKLKTQEKKRRIMEIIDKKKDQDLENRSVEDLEKMINEL